MIDHRIALGVQNPNILGEMARGTQLASAQNDLMRTAEQQNLFRQHGQGIMSGDPNALARFAQFDPIASRNVQVSVNEDRRADERLGMDRERIQMARDSVAQSLMEAQDQAAAQREAEEFDTRAREAIGLLASGDEQAFMMAVSDLVGTAMPQSREDALALLGMVYEGVKDYREALPQQPSAGDRYKTVGGQLVDLYAEGGPMPVSGIDGRSAGLSVTMPDGTVIQQGGPAVMDRAGLRSGSGEVRIADEGSPTGTAIVAEPGSEAARAIEDRERAAAGAARNEGDRSEVVTRTTGAIRSMIEKGGRRSLLDLPEVGVIGDRLNRAGINQEAADMGGLIDTLKGMVAFDRLDKLRQASATGASGLGQVTEREIALLAAQLGALDQRVSARVLMGTIDTIDDVFTRLSPEAQAYLLGETDNLPPASDDDLLRIYGGK